MRTSKQHLTLFGSDLTTYVGGRTSTTEFSKTYLVKDMSRSDIVKTPVDQNGWRKPTPYGVSDLVVNPLEGGLRIDIVGARGPAFSYTIEIGGPLDVSNSARLNAIRPLLINDAVLAASNVINRLEVQSLLKVRDQKVNLAVAFHEAEKSAALIADRAQSLYRSYHALRAGNFSQAWKAIGLHPHNKGKKIASTTLEVQYGWRPLMQDIEGAYDEMRKPVQHNGYLIKVKSGNSVTSKSKVSYNGSTTGLSTWDVNQEDVMVQNAQVVLWYYLENTLLRTASAIGLTNPAEIVWEATPYSFLLDWIVPIGNFLGALTATEGTRFVAGTKTRSTRVTRHHALIPTSKIVGGDKWIGGGTSSAVSSAFSMSREVYLASPIPSLYIKNPLSAGHAINALALLRGLL